MIKAQYTGVVVHRWKEIWEHPTQMFRGPSMADHQLAREDAKLEALFDKLAPLVQGGATLVMEQRIVNAVPVTDAPYDVIDIYVTQ